MLIRQPLRHRRARHGARKVLVAALGAVAAVAASLAAAAFAGAGPGAPEAAQPNGPTYGLETIFSGATLGISQPDDVTTMGGQLFVAFQNGVGPKGEASPSGGLDSTIVEMSRHGFVEGTWSVAGHCDGLTADPATGRLIVTVNEDLNSSIYTIDPGNPTPVQYTFSPSQLPHGGGTDAISVIDGQIYVSASAPGTTGLPAPQPTDPAMYSVQLDSASHTANLKAVFNDEDPATLADASGRGQSVALALTDPDSNEVVPPQSPRFSGDLVLDSQGDLQQVFVHHPGGADQSLSVLNLSQAVNDSAWATSESGSLFITDHANNLVDVIRGSFTPGTDFVAVTPCGSNSAPSTCPAPGFPPNYLGTLDLASGTVTPVNLGGELVQPGGLTFDPSSAPGTSGPGA